MTSTNEFLTEVKDDVAYGGPLVQLLLAVVAAIDPPIGASFAAVGGVVYAGAKKFLDGFDVGDTPAESEAKFDAVMTDMTTQLGALHAKTDAAEASLHTQEDAALAARFPGEQLADAAPSGTAIARMSPADAVASTYGTFTPPTLEQAFRWLAALAHSNAPTGLVSSVNLEQLADVLAGKLPRPS